jgi:hypothetical protein
LRSLHEIQPDFVEEAKAYAGLWSQGKKKEEEEEEEVKIMVTYRLCLPTTYSKICY